jgi:hypothetical protein
VWERLPCALCTRGPLDVSGLVEIDARQRPGSQACAPKLGVAAHHPTGMATIQAGARVWGATDGNDRENEATDVGERLELSGFDAGALGDADLDRLRDLARRNGTYFGPGFAGGGTTPDPTIPWTGVITFGPGRRLRSGVVFVDTVSGRNPSEGVAAGELADVGLDGQFWTNPDPALGSVQSFQGWIVVNGALRIAGGPSVKGLLYAADDVAVTSGAGATRIEGQVVSRNVRGIESRTLVDAGAEGTVRLTFDCDAVRQAPGLGATWTLQPGTYREVGD